MPRLSARDPSFLAHLWDDLTQLVLTDGLSPVPGNARTVVRQWLTIEMRDIFRSVDQVLNKQVYDIMIWVIDVLILANNFVVNFHVLEPSSVGLVAVVYVLQVHSSLLIQLLGKLRALKVSMLIVATQAKNLAVLVNALAL